MKGNSEYTGRSRIVLIIMGFLAACSIGLIWATAGHYLGASKAAAGFQTTITGITCNQVDSGYVIGIDVSLNNESEWDLSITSMRSIVYLDGQYLWGRNYDWLGNPLELHAESERDIVLEMEVPETKTEVVAGGGDAWSIRVSGLLDMPRLGAKLFVAKAVIPVERGKD